MLTLRMPSRLMVTANYSIGFSDLNTLQLVEFTKSFGVLTVMEEVLIKESTCNVFNETPPI